MAMDSIKAYFSSGKHRKTWEESKKRAAEAKGFTVYDDGKYTAQLVEVKVGRSQASQRLQVVWKYKMTEGEYKGKPVFKYAGIDDEEGKGIEYVLRDLKALGHDNVELEDIESDAFKALNKEKPVVKIQLKTKEGSEYQNLFVLGLAEGKAEEESEETDDEPDDSDADEPEDTPEASEDADEDDDEDGKEEAEDEADEDDEDEEEKPKEKKPVGRPKKVVAEEPEEDEEEDDDDDAEEPEASEPEEEEKVNLEVGTRLRIQHNKKVDKVKIVKIDEEGGRIKVKFADGNKEWVEASDKVIVEVLK